MVSVAAICYLIGWKQLRPGGYVGVFAEVSVQRTYPPVCCAPSLHAHRNAKQTGKREHSVMAHTTGRCTQDQRSVMVEWEIAAIYVHIIRISNGCAHAVHACFLCTCPPAFFGPELGFSGCFCSLRVLSVIPRTSRTCSPLLSASRSPLPADNFWLLWQRRQGRTHSAQATWPP